MEGAGRPAVTSSTGQAPVVAAVAVLPGGEALLQGASPAAAAATEETPSPHFVGTAQKGEVDGAIDIAAALDRCDAYWQQHFKAELLLAKTKLEMQYHQELMRQRSLMQHELNLETSRREAAEWREEALLRELAHLRRENTELTGEAEVGKLMVGQFSKLMADKASQVCQYCRRSGTLRPPSMR
mmetsp:Transcript_13942/g.36020  ORF Transcript_13942/g.36020 Transcript_13942/m.36020 type:complete len:184 (+) Transcript_13942:101-652(+)